MGIICCQPSWGPGVCWESLKPTGITCSPRASPTRRGHQPLAALPQLQALLPAGILCHRDHPHSEQPHGQAGAAEPHSPLPQGKGRKACHLPATLLPTGARGRSHAAPLLELGKAVPATDEPKAMEPPPRAAGDISPVGSLPAPRQGCHRAARAVTEVPGLSPSCQGCHCSPAHTGGKGQQAGRAGRVRPRSAWHCQDLAPRPG